MATCSLNSKIPFFEIIYPLKTKQTIPIASFRQISSNQIYLQKRRQPNKAKSGRQTALPTENYKSFLDYSVKMFYPENDFPKAL